MGQLDVSYYIERISGWTYYKIITTNVRRGRGYGWGRACKHTPKMV